MRLTILTCTCDRPQAFALCEKWMGAQTRQPEQWIVMDDSVEPVTITQGQQHYHCPDFRGRGSMAKKLRWALENNIIEGDALILIEDDDRYAPAYLAWCEEQLARFDLIGEGRNLYYNVQHRWWFDHGNISHASLCATACTRAAFPQLLKESAGDDPFIDSRLWKNYRGKKQVFDPVKLGRRLTIGIKAMPGTKGYGSGHDKDSGWAIRDPNLTKLRELIGPDAESYAIFYEAPPPPKILPQSSTLPSIEVHIVAYNEEEIIPYTLRHYKTFASRIVVHDGGSTDRTRIICEEMGVEVSNWDTQGQINDELLRILKETCWNGTAAEWVIMADADEFVYFPAGVEKSLKAYQALQLAVVKCRGFEMESGVFPTTAGQIYEEVKHGAPDDKWYGKPILLCPKRIKSIHFVHGAHGCEVTLHNGRKLSNPVAASNPLCYLLHMHHLGPVERIGARYDGNKSRFSDVNKRHGWGWQGDGLAHARQKRAAIMNQRRKII